MRTLTLSLVLLAALQGSVAAQITINVPGDHPNIQVAINVAQNGDTVLVAPGSYTGSLNFFGKAVTVASSGGPGVTTIVGLAGTRVVRFVTQEGRSSILQGFTVSGGAGGILIENSSPTINDCHIVGNTASDGGGIFVNAPGGTASPTVSGCTIVGNTALDSGGGVTCEASSGGTAIPIFDQCTVRQNVAMASSSAFDSGGGFMIRGLDLATSSTGICSPTITDCEVTENFGVRTGGGLYVARAAGCFIERCRITDNVALMSNFSSGGGLNIDGASVTIVGSVISGNQAQTSGAGILAISSSGESLIVQGCTIVDNVGGVGGGISLGGNMSAVVTNSIIRWNTGGGLVNTSSAAVTVTHSNIVGGQFPPNSTNISNDPLFHDRSSGDYHIASSSPCREAGGPGTVSSPALDIDGGPRIEGVIDIGADEVRTPNLPGSGEDLDLRVVRNGTTDPSLTTIPVAAGDAVTIVFDSPGQTFTGGLPLIAGELYAAGFPPSPVPGFPELKINGGPGTVLVFGSPTPPPIGAPGLPSDGITIATLIPPGFSGFVFRLQGFVVAAIAANAYFASSDARDLVL